MASTKGIRRPAQPRRKTAPLVPLSPRQVSVERPEQTAQPKTGSLLSEAFLAWTRQQACIVCGKRGASEAHHTVKRSRGFRDDSSTIPVCRPCHRRCEGELVDGLPALPRAQQQELLALHLAAFLTEAPIAALIAFAADRQRHEEKRIW